jgi:NitT/TauT family transport system substrate-binding protein
MKIRIGGRGAARPRSSAALVAGLIAVLLLAACGGGGKRTHSLASKSGTTTTVVDTSTSAPDAGAATSTTAAAAAAATTPRSSKALRVPTALTGPPPTAKPGQKAVTVRLGYFPNVTHAPAMVAIEKGFFVQALGFNGLQTSIFNAGPSAVEALFSGAIDAAYIGPNPTINAFVQSHGQAVRAISGATSGGASFVVKQNINSADDLRGKKVASPQLGNTQDVALRYWLKQHGLKTDTQGGGDVSIVPQDNSQTLQTFQSNQIQGAWVPEPWVTRLVNEGGGKVLVDERSLWDGGQFVTTNIVVRTAFLNDHPDVVRDLLVGQVEATDFIQQHPDESQKIVNDDITKATGKGISPSVMATAWTKMSFTNDPIARSLALSAQHAQDVGLLDPNAKLDGIYDLRLINDVLKQFGKPQVSAG